MEGKKELDLTKTSRTTASSSLGLCLEIIKEFSRKLCDTEVLKEKLLGNAISFQESTFNFDNRSHQIYQNENNVPSNDDEGNVKSWRKYVFFNMKIFTNENLSLRGSLYGDQYIA